MANKVLQDLESAVTWLSSGGTAAFTPTSLATASGRQGAHHDLGNGSVGRWFAWRAWMKPGGTRVVGEWVEVYLKTADASSARPDNDDGTGDIAVSAADKLRNLKRLGAIVIDENAAVEMVASGFVFIAHQIVAPVFWNRSANTLSSTAGDFGFQLIPVVDEIQ